MASDVQPSQSERQITFLVTLPASEDLVVIATAKDREEAKRLARPVLKHDRRGDVVACQHDEPVRDLRWRIQRKAARTNG